MLKSLAILGGAVLLVAVILMAAYYQQRNAISEGYDIKCVQPSEPPSAANSLTCEIHPSQNADQGKSKPPWWNVLLAWPDGITAWLLMLTLGAIFWQSFATAKSAEAAFLQIRMMKDKERARVEIKAKGLELEHEAEEFWNLKTTIEIRNVGAGRAYVRLGVGNFTITERNVEPPTKPDYWNPLNVVDGFIDPTGDPHTESFYFFQTENLDLLQCSQQICDGRLRLYITGFIEYETVGTRFHRDFNYVWLGNDNPDNIGARFLFTDDSKPRTNEDRIAFGFWNPQQFRENGEYEMEPPKKTKPRQNPN